MGVFARLLRRSKATEEASTAETQADVPTAESAAEEAAEAKEPTDAEGADGSTATEAVEDAAAEGVEIPKQQSAEAAADHEAGDGART
ncbi:hypothetical protein [Streptomyces sp. NPDC005760]|uniref:hypothetical protein n=1 Tax=Streptomyces sp. NPDC005760 TaxID=3156718 RepID=UPI0033F60D79